MMQYHHYNLSELEGLIPWERDVYLAQLIEYIEVENEKMQLAYIEEQRAKSRNSSPMGY
jgi:hypothetical protein